MAAPRTADAVSQLVSRAVEKECALIPRGAGTGMPGGNVGRGVIVDLATHHCRIGDPDPSDGTVCVQAGAIADDIIRKVAPAGFTFPALPSSARWCTIGGMIANNAAGARSFKYGSVRDGVVQLEVVLPDGTLVRLSRTGDTAGLLRLGERLGFGASTSARGVAAESLLSAWPRVRKNSSGYALDRYLRSGRLLDLLIGAEGTLGIITSATLRLHRDPEARALLLLRARDASEFERVIRSATAIGASACEFFGARFVELAGLDRDAELAPFTRNAEALFLIEVDGSVEDVEAKIPEVEKLARSIASPARLARTPEERTRLWQIRHAASPTIARQAEEGLISMQFIEDSVVPVERFAEYVSGVQRILASREMDAVVFGHAGDGNAHVNPLVDVGRSDWRSRVRAVLEDTVDLVSELGGTLSGEHGDGRVRAPFLSRIWDARLVRSFRQVKEAFDPAGVMNPGVILPLEGQDPLDGIGTGFPGR